MSHALRMVVPVRDEASLARLLGDSLAPGGIRLPTSQRHPPGTPITFVLASPEGESLFSGSAQVVRAEAPQPQQPTGALLVRFVRLTGSERAVLDRLLLHRDGLGQLDLPSSKGVTEPARGPLGFVALDVGGTRCRAAVIEEGEPSLVEVGVGGVTWLHAAIGFDEKAREVRGARARALRGMEGAAALDSPLPLLRFDPLAERDRAELSALPVTLREDEEKGPVAELPRASVPAVTLASRVLAELRTRAQEQTAEPIDEGHLLVSPCWSPRMRHLLGEALREAGFQVEVLVDTPSAIAAGFGHDLERLPPGPLLLIDWGGTTLQVSVLDVVDDRIAVLAAGEKRQLGGAAADGFIARELEKRLERLTRTRVTDATVRQRVLDAAEIARVELSSKSETRVRIPFVAMQDDGTPIDLDVTMKAEPLQKLLEPAVEEVLRAVDATLEAAAVEGREIHEVLLAGGQASWPALGGALEERFPRKVRAGREGVAVLGAARLAELRRAHRFKGGEGEHAPARLDASLSVLGAEGKLIPVLGAGTPLPARGVLALKPTGTQGMVCAVVEGAQLGNGAGYLGAVLLPRIDAPAQLSVGVSVDGTVDLQLTCGTKRAVHRTTLRHAERSVQAAAFARAALPS